MGRVGGCIFDLGLFEGENGSRVGSCSFVGVCVIGMCWLVGPVEGGWGIYWW